MAVLNCTRLSMLGAVLAVLCASAHAETEQPDVIVKEAPDEPLPIPFPLSGCGAGGEPVCAGDDLVGREFECDYGYVGEDGVCVEWEPTPSGEDCGGDGEPVCAGDDLADREFECDYGFVGEDGVCVPWTEPTGTPTEPPAPACNAQCCPPETPDCLCGGCGILEPGMVTVCAAGGPLTCCENPEEPCNTIGEAGCQTDEDCKGDPILQDPLCGASCFDGECAVFCA